MLDSFVLPGECYTILPALSYMELDPHATEQVVPRVCVESLNKGMDITISVTFLDPNTIASYDKKDVEEIVCQKNGVMQQGSTSSTSG